MLSNKFHLPQAWCEAVSNDPYTKGESDITVTELVSPPLIRVLRQKFGESQEDVSDRTWAVLGQACHSVLERASGQQEQVEKRVYADVDGWVVGGQFDNLDLRSGVLSDYKVTSVWSIIGPTKVEWTAQLNLLDYLLTMQGYQVKQLQIVAILRDWSKSKAKSGDYPVCNVAVLPVVRWDLQSQIDYINRRVALHQAAEINMMYDILPAECTPSERWEKAPKFALMKEGRKSAVKLFDVREECEQALVSAGAKHYIELRPGERARCAGNYCGVAANCPYWQAIQESSQVGDE